MLIKSPLQWLWLRLWAARKRSAESNYHHLLQSVWVQVAPLTMSWQDTLLASCSCCLSLLQISQMNLFVRKTSVSLIYRSAHSCFCLVILWVSLQVLKRRCNIPSEQMEPQKPSEEPTSFLLLFFRPHLCIPRCFCIRTQNFPNSTQTPWGTPESNIVCIESQINIPASQNLNVAWGSWEKFNWMQISCDAWWRQLGDNQSFLFWFLRKHKHRCFLLHKRKEAFKSFQILEYIT